MADGTQIEWTDATWNPVTGCSKITAGCDNCYAERFSERFRGVPGHPFENGFDLTLRPARLKQPLQWRQPRHDLRQLHERPLPQGGAASNSSTRSSTPWRRPNWHTFQVLTKRSSLLTRYLETALPGQPGTVAYLAGRVGRGRKQNAVRIKHLQAARAA